MFFHFCAFGSAAQSPTSGHDNAKTDSTVATRGPLCFWLDLTCFSISALFGRAQLQPQEAMPVSKPTQQLPHRGPPCFWLDPYVFRFCSIGRAQSDTSGNASVPKLTPRLSPQEDLHVSGWSSHVVPFCAFGRAQAALKKPWQWLSQLHRAAAKAPPCFWLDLHAFQFCALWKWPSHTLKKQ